MKKKQTKVEKKETKRKKETKPKYIPLKGLMNNAVDYNVYTMNIKERITGFGIGFLVGFAYVYVFFRVIAFSTIIGIGAGIWFQKPFEMILLEKRKRNLLLQFKDLLDSLAASYAAGLSSPPLVFKESCKELKSIYGQDSEIVYELETIIFGMESGFTIEALLRDFAKRSGLDDIKSFADVFEIGNRKGTEMRKLVSDTRRIINDKIEIEMEIQTMLSGNKNQLYIMVVMPLIIMITLSGMGTMSVVTNSFTNIIVKIGVLALMGAAYLMGKKIINIKV